MTAPDIDEPPFQFSHTMGLSLADTTLHDSRDLVNHRTDIWLFGSCMLGAIKAGVS